MTLTEIEATDLHTCSQEESPSDFLEYWSHYRLTEFCSRHSCLDLKVRKKKQELIRAIIRSRVPVSPNWGLDFKNDYALDVMQMILPEIQDALEINGYKPLCPGILSYMTMTNVRMYAYNLLKDRVIDYRNKFQHIGEPRLFRTPLLDLFHRFCGGVSMFYNLENYSDLDVIRDFNDLLPIHTDNVDLRQIMFRKVENFPVKFREKLRATAVKVLSDDDFLDKDRKYFENLSDADLIKFYKEVNNLQKAVPECVDETHDEDEVDYESMSIAELRRMARNEGIDIKGLKRVELIEELEDLEDEIDLDEMDDDEILALAKDEGMKVTKRTKVAAALEYLKEILEDEDEDEDDYEEDEDEDWDNDPAPPPKFMEKNYHVMSHRDLKIEASNKGLNSCYDWKRTDIISALIVYDYKLSKSDNEVSFKETKKAQAEKVGIPSVEVRQLFIKDGWPLEKVALMSDELINHIYSHFYGKEV